MMRVCRKCRIRKSLDKFKSPESLRTNIRYTCRECLGSVKLRSCNRCHVSKPLDAFTNDKNRPLGKHYTCRQCLQEMDKPWNRTPRAEKLRKARVRRYDFSEKGQSRKKKWNKLTITRERSANKWLKARYNINMDTWRSMYLDQKGKCACCNVDIKGDTTTHVDHDHKTKKVRGLLCRYCNLALGLIHDSVERARYLIKYLEKHKVKHADT